MSGKQIDEKYISDFFGIEEGPKGKRKWTISVRLWKEWSWKTGPTS